jgi:hypothetical protein
MLLHALAGVIFLDLGDPQPQQLVPLVRRQPVERLVGAGQVRRQRKAERAQQLGAVEAGGEHALLDLGGDRLAVDGGGEGEEVDRVLGRHRDDLVLLVDLDLGHQERDQHGDRLVRFVEEAVADVDLLRRDAQVLGLHLDVAHEDEPAGGELGRRVVGQRRHRCRHRDGKSDR